MRLLFLFLSVCAVAPAQQRLFSFQPAHTAFSTSLNRLVLSERNPNRLHLYDPATGNDTVLPLPAAPTAISVSPDGLTAAVGHQDQVTYSELTSAALLRSLRVPGAVREIRLAPPSAIVDLGNDNIRTLSVASGALSEPLPGVRSLASALLAPDGQTLYLPRLNQLDRVDLLTGAIASSPLRHCGRILFSPDASRLYTACASIHQNTPGLPYVGTLQPGRENNLLAASSGFLAIADRQTVSLYNNSGLGVTGQIGLPRLDPGSGLVPFPTGLFFNAAGSRLYVVSFGETVNQAPTFSQAGVQTFDLTARAGNCVSSV